MEFYTNIQVSGDNVLVRSIDGEQRLKYREEFFPTLYTLSHKNDTENVMRSYNDEELKQISPGSIRDCRAFIKNNKGVVGMPLYGNIDYIYQYISQREWYRCDHDLEKVLVCNIDIETESEYGFPRVEEAKEAITAITIKDNYTKKFWVFGRGEFVTNRDDVVYLNCKDERELIERFLDAYSKLKPDVITGWNIETFDIPYLVRRIKNLFPDKEYEKKMSPWRMIKERVIEKYGRDHFIYKFYGVSQLDYIDLYKKYTYINRESYRLDHIAFVELDEKKLSYDEYDNIHQFYKMDYQKFIEYNIKDVELVERLDEKLKLIDLIMTMAYDTGVNYEDVFSPVKRWDVLIYNHLKSQNISIPPKNYAVKKDEYEGAYVKEPIVGMHDWVVSFDLNSLYPHLIMQYNISPDTVSHSEFNLDKDGKKKMVNDLLEQNVDLPDLSNRTMTPNGSFYRTDKQGFLPELMQIVYNERVEAKDEMQIAQRELQHEQGFYKKQELENKIAKLDNIQMAKKISLNSAYGALANQYFRYFDINQAEAITYSGQLSIRWIENKLNVYLNKVLDTENEDYVVASDTDSVYLVLGTLVEKFLGSITDKNKIIDSLDKFCEDKLVPYITKCYQELADYLNAYEQKMFMSREAIADKGIWTAKKRYILNVFDNEGVRYAEPYMKIMGIEAVRSSTPSACRETIKESMKVIMEKTEDDMIDFIAYFKEQFFEMDPVDTSFPRTVNGLNKYNCPDRLYKKGTPIHVKGSIIFNKMLKDRNLEKTYESIKEGDKIKFTYLKEPNPTGDKVIAFLNSIPREFEFDGYIDYELQFEKSYLDPIKTILDVLGWKHEKIGSLESFFV
jgi:DNA polymerase elongation subunit (family B)